MAPKVKFLRNERVAIVAGTHKDYRFGTYLGPYGIRGKMARIKVDGVTGEKHLFMASIEPLHANNDQKRHSKQGQDVLCIHRADYEDALQDIDDLTKMVSKIQLKAHRLKL